MRQKSFFIIISLILVFSATGLKAQDTGQKNNNSDSLVILWTSDDPLLAERMVLM